MKSEEAKLWLDFAERDLRRARNNSGMGDYDLAAYLLQQSCEKSLKAVLIKYGRTPPRTHNIRALIGEITEVVDFPEYLIDAVKLSRYAFEVRYPDDYVPVSEEEYREAYDIALKVYEWARGVVSN